jgi:hypothetical protein
MAAQVISKARRPRPAMVVVTARARRGVIASVMALDPHPKPEPGPSGRPAEYYDLLKS